MKALACNRATVIFQHLFFKTILFSWNNKSFSWDKAPKEEWNACMCVQLLWWNYCHESNSKHLHNTQLTCVLVQFNSFTLSFKRQSCQLFLLWSLFWHLGIQTFVTWLFISHIGIPLSVRRRFFFQGKKATCSLQLITLQGIWVGCLDYKFGKPATRDSSTLYYQKTSTYKPSLRQGSCGKQLVLVPDFEPDREFIIYEGLLVSAPDFIKF